MKRNRVPTTIPLTCDDILLLKNKPAIRKTIKSFCLHPNGKTAPVINKQWIYYNQISEEHYFFENEKLVQWTKIPCNYSRVEQPGKMLCRSTKMKTYKTEDKLGRVKKLRSNFMKNFL